LRTWARCEPGRDVEAHARTVVAQLRDKATFARLGDLAAAISVEYARLVGLYCLAVAPSHRRAGLGTRMVRALLASARATAPTAYLQVEETNAAALAMYARLGFTEAYRYCHRTAPDG
jgi:ribosomal protein S18 acetylase RimI-like enzyme